MCVGTVVTLCILLNLDLVLGCSVVVKDLPALALRLVDESQTHICVSGTLQLGNKALPWDTITLARNLSLEGVNSALLLWELELPPFILQSRGTLTVSNIVVANLTPESGQAQSVDTPVSAFVSSGGSIRFENVILHQAGSLLALQQASGFWARALQSGLLSAETAADTAVVKAANYTLGNYKLHAFRLALGGLSCYSTGAIAFDSKSLRDALTNNAVSSIYLLNDIKLAAAHFPGSAATNLPMISRALSIKSCPGVVLDLNLLQSAVLVTDGGLLQLVGFTITGSRAVRHRNLWPDYNPLLLSILNVGTTGMVLLQSVRLLVLHPQEVHSRITAQLQPPEATWPAVAAYDTLPAFVINSWSVTRIESFGGSATGRKQLGNPVVSGWAFQNVTVQQAEQSPCFHDYPGIQVKSAAEFWAALADASVSHVEIVNDIILSQTDWPRESLQPQSGWPINITRNLELRACHPQGLSYTVDFGNLNQVVLVHQLLRWSGDLLLVGSLPLASRDFLYCLIGALAAVGDGVIEFQDVSIRGVQPSPLQRADDPFWRYGPGVVPEPNQFSNVTPQALLLLDFSFSEAVWARLAQGRNISGSASWHFIKTWLEWEPEGQQPSSSQPTAAVVHGKAGRLPLVAVVLPAVFCALLLTVMLGACCFLCLRWLRGMQAAERRRGQVGDEEARSDSQQDVTVQLAGRSTGHGINSALLEPSGRQPLLRQKTIGTEGLATERIEEVRRALTVRHTARGHHDEITLEQLLGEGTFGKVFQGHWRGSPVAVKSMVLPPAMSGREKGERMAIMETAISSSLSHPNIVQTYTYTVQPLQKALARPPGWEAPADDKGLSLTALSSEGLSGDTDKLGEMVPTAGWEVRLVLEFCDRGSLRDALNNNTFAAADGNRNLMAMVETAMDCARAMLHLHGEQIVHGDLKARNILLKSGGTDIRGFIAKVADFGLSIKVDPTAGFVSNVYQGTMTHMAPEVLTAGRVSKASDVYAFGILMWELFTGGHAFKGMARALLGHEVAHSGCRPEFPPETPLPYMLLACRCWEGDAGVRPSFQEVLDDLKRLQQHLAGQRQLLVGLMQMSAAPRHGSTQQSSRNLASSMQQTGERLAMQRTSSSTGAPLATFGSASGRHVAMLATQEGTAGPAMYSSPRLRRTTSAPSVQSLCSERPITDSQPLGQDKEASSSATSSEDTATSRTVTMSDTSSEDSSSSGGQLLANSSSASVSYGEGAHYHARHAAQARWEGVAGHRPGRLTLPSAELSSPSVSLLSDHIILRSCDLDEDDVASERPPPRPHRGSAGSGRSVGHRVTELHSLAATRPPTRSSGSLTQCNIPGPAHGQLSRRGSIPPDDPRWHMSEVALLPSPPSHQPDTARQASPGGSSQERGSSATTPSITRSSSFSGTPRRPRAVSRRPSLLLDLPQHGSSALTMWGEVLERSKGLEQQR